MCSPLYFQQLTTEAVKKYNSEMQDLVSISSILSVEEYLVAEQKIWDFHQLRLNEIYRSELLTITLK